MFIRYVTITGVDSKTDLDRLITLSVKYPFVEWGVLYSPSRAGNENRYMSQENISRFTNHIAATIGKTQSNLSLHLCGKGVDNLLDGSLAGHLFPFKRIQLNFNYQRISWSIDRLLEIAPQYLAGHQIIVQDNENNQEVFKKMYHLSNIAMLRDASGGRGVEEVGLTQQDIPRGLFYGFAGGINPTNVDLKLSAVRSLLDNPRSVTWIDMESGVRTDDWLDLDKVAEVLSTVKERWM